MILRAKLIKFKKCICTFTLSSLWTPRGLSLLPLACTKQPNPQTQWDIESSSSTEQQQPQAEATTLLHESPNSKPETIEQRKIIFHYIRVRVAWMRVVPLVRAKPIKERAQRQICQHKTQNSVSLVQIKQQIKHKF